MKHSSLNINKNVELDHDNEYDFKIKSFTIKIIITFLMIRLFNTPLV